ncbi:MAG: hypothetical protein WDZ94_04930 [Patescibacteria group bacterium]
MQKYPEIHGWLLVGLQVYSFQTLLEILRQNFVLRISITQPLTLITQLIAVVTVFLLFRTLTQTAQLIFQPKVTSSDFAPMLQMSIVVLSMILGLQVLLSV